MSATSYRGVISGKEPRPDTQHGSDLGSIWDGLRRYAGKRAIRARASLRTTRRVTMAHIRDHGLTWCAIGCVDAAFFQLDAFWGLLVTGVLFFLFEMKVGE